jgi:hypothetical protein
MVTAAARFPVSGSAAADAPGIAKGRSRDDGATWDRRQSGDALRQRAWPHRACLRHPHAGSGALSLA